MWKWKPWSRSHSLSALARVVLPAYSQPVRIRRTFSLPSSVLVCCRCPAPVSIPQAYHVLATSSRGLCGSRVTLANKEPANKEPIEEAQDTGAHVVVLEVAGVVAHQLPVVRHTRVGVAAA